MKISIVIINFLISFSLFSQQRKDQIKINIQLELDSNCFRKQKFYSAEEKGVILNNECKTGPSFLFSDNCKADTLSISKLKNYKVSSIEEIKKMEKKWRKERFKEVQKKNKETGTYNLPIHTFDKNYIFETYLIEIISDQQFVVYPVKWRGQGIKI